jgi:hypothetical protein
MNKRVNKKLKIADNRPRARFRLHKSLNLLFALPKVRPLVIGEDQGVQLRWGTVSMSSVSQALRRLERL